MIITDTQTYRLFALKGALKLEVLGLKHSRFSAYAIIKKEFGYKGSKKSVFAQFSEHLNNL